MITQVYKISYIIGFILSLLLHEILKKSRIWIIYEDYIFEENPINSLNTIKG